MPSEGKAKVLNKDDFSTLITSIDNGNHAKRNLALIHVSFQLGLRAKEMAALRIFHVIGMCQGK